jgi:hypothetical protein
MSEANAPVNARIDDLSRYKRRWEQRRAKKLFWRRCRFRRAPIDVRVEADRQAALHTDRDRPPARSSRAMRYMMFIKHTEDYRNADVPASSPIQNHEPCTFQEPDEQIVQRLLDEVGLTKQRSHLRGGRTRARGWSCRSAPFTSQPHAHRQARDRLGTARPFKRATPRRAAPRGRKKDTRDEARAATRAAQPAVRGPRYCRRSDVTCDQNISIRWTTSLHVTSLHD